MCYPEYVSEDILDADFVKCFAPIHVLQFVLGSMRVDLRNSFVTTTTLSQKLYTLVWILLSTFSLINFELFYYKAYFNTNKILFFTCTSGAFMQYVSYLVNIVYVRFYNQEESVEVYLMLQKIDRSFKMCNFKSLNDNLYVVNVYFMLYVTFAYISGLLVFVFTSIERPVFILFIGFSLITIYLELLITGSFLYYLSARLRVLNNILKYNIIRKNRNKIVGKNLWIACQNNNPGVIELSLTEHQNDAMELNKIVACTKTILEAYKKVSDLFQFPVLNIAVTLFIWTFLVIETAVVGLRTKLTPIIATVTINMCIAFYFSLLITLACICDWFTNEVHNIKMSCVHLLSCHYEGPLYVAAKSMIKLVEFQKPVFTVCEIFNLTKCLPLKLIGLITSNVLVLIQFTVTD